MATLASSRFSGDKSFFINSVSSAVMTHLSGHTGGDVDSIDI